LGADPAIKDNRGMSALDYGTLYDSFESIDMVKEAK